MSDEIAHTSGGDHVNSNVGSKDTLNSYSRGATPANSDISSGVVEGRAHCLELSRVFC